MAVSWKGVGSPKHAEKMLIQLRSAMTPSWPTVHCSFTTIHKLIGGDLSSGHGDISETCTLWAFITSSRQSSYCQCNTLEPQIGDPLIIFTFLLENTHFDIECNGFMPFSGPMYNISSAKKILQIFQYATD